MGEQVHLEVFVAQQAGLEEVTEAAAVVVVALAAAPAMRMAAAAQEVTSLEI